MIRKMAMASLIGKVGIIIKVTISMMKDMVTVKCIGLMVRSIKVNGKMEFKMGKE